jgi:hypothetical protein
MRRYSPGTLVAVRELQKRPELNGAQGGIVSYNEQTKRYSVMMMSDGTQEFVIALKPDNLIRVQVDPRVQ